MTDDDRLYRSREFDDEAAARLIKDLLQVLCEKEVATRPGDDDVTLGKHVAARMALIFAGQLIDAVAGWAIDHQIGLAVLAKQNLPPLPIMPDFPRPLRKLSEQVVAEAAALDRNTHEMKGGETFENDEFFEPGVARRAIINVLEPMRGIFPSALHQQLVEGLQALEYGEEPSIFAPVRGSLRLQSKEKELQLRALGHVEFRVHRSDRRKNSVQEEVSGKFSCSVETLKSWDKRLREEEGVGIAMIMRELAFAVNAAENEKAGAFVASEYSDSALTADGQRFKRLGEKVH